MKHIRTRLFFGFISMAILTIVVLWAIQAGLMNDVYRDERIRTVRENLEDAALAGSINYDNLSEVVNGGLIAFSGSGQIEYSSQRAMMQGMMTRTIRNLVPEGADGEVRYVRAMSSSIEYAVVGVPRPDGGYLFAVFSMTDLDEYALVLRRQLLLITAILFGMSLLLAVFLSRRMSRPIRAVTRAARELAAGQTAIDLPVTTQDEIGQLTIALNELAVELGRTEQLRRELIANVSHELRSPLTVIQGYAETVRDVTWPDELKRTEQLNMIASEASRLTRVVKDILDYSRLQSGVGQINPVTISIRPVLEDFARRFELEAQKRQLNIRVDSPDLDMVFDRDRLEQVLHNLVANAINHADAGSEIVMTASQQDQKVMVEISNQGKAIPDHELSQIWDRYYRSGKLEDSRALGTGLGLAIAKSIFEKHPVDYGIRQFGGRVIFWFEARQAL